MTIKFKIPGKQRASSFDEEELEVLEYLYKERENEVWTSIIQDRTKILFIRQPLEALKRKGLVSTRRSEVGNDAHFKPWWITDLGEQTWIAYTHQQYGEES